jgi:hypothetical protein
MTHGLLKLCEWLEKAECTHVAMESTDVFWIPIFNILEADFEVILVNAKHIKNVPGRKTGRAGLPVDSAAAAAWTAASPFHPTVGDSTASRSYPGEKEAEPGSGVGC